MKYLLSLSVLLSSTMAFGASVRPTYSVTCVLTAVAQKMNVELSSEIPAPTVVYASDVELSQFQDDVEGPWGMRPEVVLNVYLPEINKIYLLDDQSYYSKFGRTIDDSLAHELAHYVQVKYGNASLSDGNSDQLEMEAVGVQRWLREAYMATGTSPCAN